MTIAGGYLHGTRCANKRSCVFTFGIFCDFRETEVDRSSDQQFSISIRDLAQSRPTKFSRMSSTPAASKPSLSELDLTNASRGVWLVKVPKYISSRWENAKEQTEVGKLLISKGADGTPEIKFNLSEELIKVQVDKNDPKDAKTKQVKKATPNEKSAGQSLIALDAKPIQPKNSLIGVKKDIVLSNKAVEIPREHKFAISDISHQHLAVFSEQIDDKSRRLVLEGNVVQKGECRPIADSRYMDLKKQRIVEARQPTRLVQQLDKAVVNKIKATTVRPEAETRRRNDQKKSREDKDKVLDMLFAAFEKHQYYYLRDLEKITNQPVSYLKEILKEVALHNVKNPHKNMWELKPEYRHYKPSTEDNDSKME